MESAHVEILISNYLLLTAGLPLCTTAQHVIDLSGNGWTVKNSEGNVSVPGSSPSQAHLDLFAANVICESYYGLNDIDLHWISWSNWTYTSEPITGLLVCSLLI
ncbi:hypothetical protein OIDMADRAFT_126328 [Oidiodendron maius Zn]|uniref:Beta-mannosidase-like galactose-binding domain-containing protein n=1 Tax=Oidiodendron maius (strain Zn) TaxID=913774 RepID=A0A0C3CM19_OIDMZ|nr:hypothetical protein OIDMADRAFT_126328 [Oidiodendron maius Zn]